MKRLLVIGAAMVGALGVVMTASASSPHGGLVVTPFVSVAGVSGPGGCTQEGTVEVCHVTLTNPSSSNEKVSWISIGTNDWSNGIDGAAPVVKPSSGTLAPGKSVKVTITADDCGDGGAYDDLGMFLGGPNYQYGSAVLYACD